MSIEKITAQEIYDNSIERLADRPYAPSRYGEGGLTSEELKRKFDALPKLAINKLNTLLDLILNSDASDRNKSICDLILTPIDDGNGSYFTLWQILDSVCNESDTSFAQLLKVGDENLDSFASAMRSAVGDATDEASAYGSLFARVRQNKNDIEELGIAVPPPESDVSVGKLIKIKTYDPSTGRVTTECADEPQCSEEYGTKTVGDSLIALDKAAMTDISSRSSDYKPIVPSNLDTAVKAALCDGTGDEWSDSEKIAAVQRMRAVRTSLGSVAVPGVNYYLGTKTTVNLTLPASAEVGDEISVVWYNGSTPATLSITGNYIGTACVPVANVRSELNFLYDGICWCMVFCEAEVDV